jgi:hypothetical protein
MKDEAEGLILRAMRHIRRWLYALGVRPRPGSIFYSPSLALLLSAKGANERFIQSYESTFPLKETENGTPQP